jgi:peptidoglycan/xylan/chitin deacetylase (PgdA/CDA1 family)
MATVAGRARARLVRGARRVERLLRGPQRPELLVLYYHRVADLEQDPQLLAVSPRNFAAQLRELRRGYAPLGLREALARLAEGRLPPRAVALTLDDGYADNLTTARPLLEAERIPATVFVATGWLDGAAEFYWDEVERLLLQPGRLPRRLWLDDGTHGRGWDLGRHADYTARERERHSGWTVLRRAPTARHRVYRELLAHLDGLDRSRRAVALDALRTQAGVTATVRATHRPLVRGEVARLAAGNLIEIGAHTVSHARLSWLPGDARRREVASSKRELEEALGRAVTAFSYPFGQLDDYDAATVAEVRRAGFSLACTTAPDLAAPGVDPLLVPRYGVKDWDGPAFAARLRRWLGA